MRRLGIFWHFCVLQEFKFSSGSLYANLANASGLAIGAGQMGNSATLVQIAEESLAALYIHSGL